MQSIAEVIEILEKIFDKANEKFYNNEIIKPMITVQTARPGILGWCSRNQVWHNKSNGDNAFEINIVAEQLNRPIEGVVATMLHEMVHLYNNQNGIDDCTKTQYHNVKFRDCALTHGLKMKFAKVDKARGFSYTELNDKGIEFTKELGIGNFDINRGRLFDLGDNGPKTKNPDDVPTNPTTKIYTFECDCGVKIRNKDPNLEIICCRCHSKFKIKVKKLFTN